MENLIEITPNCFIVKNSDGFKELLKRLECIESEYFDYHYKVMHLTDDEDTIDHIKTIPQCDSDTGEELYNDDGTMKMWDIKYYKQYPIKYPCLLTVQDDTFDCNNYTLYIKYMIEIDDTILQIGKSPVASGDDPISKAFEEYWDKEYPNCMTILNHDEYLQKKGYVAGYKKALKNVRHELLKRIVNESNTDGENEVYLNWINDVIEKVDSDRYE